MKKLDKRLFRMIKNTKGQYFAVLSIIITGIFVFTAVSNSALNLKDSLNDYYKKTNFADIFVSAMGLPEKIESSLIGQADIKEAEARLVFDTSFITEEDDEKVNVRVVSINKNENKINKLFIKSGKRELTEKDIIIIEQFALARNIHVGEQIKIQINGKQYKFNVSGIASSSEYAYIMENEQTLLPDPENFGIVYIEDNYLRQIYGSKGNYNEILIKINNENNLVQTKDFLEDALDKYGVKRVIKKDEQLSHSMLSQEIEGLEMMSQSVPYVFLIFAGIMLSSMLSRIVKKDRTSIGILKALGYQSSEIISHYLKYAASVGIVGGLLGSIIGSALSGAMTNYYLVFFNIPTLTIKVYYNRIVVSVILSCIFCIISGYWGVKGITKINPSESMKPESPKKGKRIFIENIKFVWNNVTFSWKMVLRSIFREKKKFAFIGAAVAITCGMMIMTIWMIDVMDAMFNRQYTEFMKMQYNISFSGFQNENIKKEVAKYINPKDMEGRIELPFEIENGRNSKIVNIIGLDKNTEFYGFQDMKGNSLKVPEDGILISSNLANNLHAKVGDEVLIKNFIPNKDDRYVKVRGIIKQSLGINGYMNIDYLNDKLLDREIINGIYLNSDDDVQEKLKDIKNISSIQSQADMRGAFEEFTTITAISMGFMVMFSGLLGFVIVYSMTLMSINERTLEFSSLRVMGFSKKEIFYMLIRENMIMSFIGIIIGIPLGLWLVDYMGKSFTTDVYTMNEPVRTNSIVVSIILTIVFLSLAQFMTYAKIHKLDFMQALKNRIS
ncbi:putative ABC transport system permease protein [Sedimentibacter acidaminivorans]|uniref:ABC transport system permease protein n=1 Tax=Sedimentibacter acidaminivorans TaxID=913099 RepID=A0ABS4GE02_9FIRM|nr:ABC transporter permease [Sedimentibacter acidaminivorans]MBP1925921.1 putative ABC transport system permease protein [Sedimentibacter acidaminivorans]